MDISAIDVTQIIVTLINLVGAYILAIKDRDPTTPTPGPHPPPKPSKWVLGMWACITIAAVNTGIFVWRVSRPLPSTEVTITHPANLSRVDQTELVRGMVQGLSEGQVIWVVVFRQEVGRYYPQNRPADLEASNKWSSLVYIGIQSDTDKKFDIIAVMADTNAHNAFNIYLADARDRGDWAGMEALPEGAVIYDRVTVRRE